MSLVITIWDKSVGIAVCEGRAIAKVNGEKIPVREDCSKLSRLADGSILGLTGALRPGYETTSFPNGAVTDGLRREIYELSETHGFRELCAVMPDLLADYGLKYPELSFGISLLGNDDGTIRGASFSSTCPACIPDGSDVSANVLGLSEAANQEAAIAVRKYIASKPRNFVRVVEAANALREIISDLATRYASTSADTFQAYVGTTLLCQRVY